MVVAVTTSSGGLKGPVKHRSLWEERSKDNTVPKIAGINWDFPSLECRRPEEDSSSFSSSMPIVSLANDSSTASRTSSSS
ncbi:hypothetical protein IHE44_0002073 [Lamprotornis superbus]|uniref:Uncharacterized protein n=1 Tax=Lamprotornis superbus TaxID=245042 RepID=A0A835NV26_9PASS|nr:hypothetical protein IHE44_0002073 [Lamprotornis superbus]